MWTSFSLLGKSSNHCCVLGHHWCHQMPLVMPLRIWWWCCWDLGPGPQPQLLGECILLREGCDTVILITSVTLTNHLRSGASILVHTDEMFWVVTVYITGCVGCDYDQPTMNCTPSIQWPHCVFYIVGPSFFTYDVILWSSYLLLDPVFEPRQ